MSLLILRNLNLPSCLWLSHRFSFYLYSLQCCPRYADFHQLHCVPLLFLFQIQPWSCLEGLSLFYSFSSLPTHIASATSTCLTLMFSLIIHFILHVPSQYYTLHQLSSLLLNLTNDNGHTHSASSLSRSLRISSHATTLLFHGLVLLSWVHLLLCPRGRNISLLL